MLTQPTTTGSVIFYVKISRLIKNFSQIRGFVYKKKFVIVFTYFRANTLQGVNKRDMRHIRVKTTPNDFAKLKFII